MQRRQKYYFLYPLAWLYGLAVAVRNLLYDRGILPSREHDIPVICVGNLSVGGTGKTIHVDYLVRLLKLHFRVAVLSRGYKRKTRVFRIVTPDDTVATAGDEPLQLALRHPDITVAVDRNRNHGVEQITRICPETQVIIMDDGFQHRSIVPGKAIVLSEFSNLYINDCLMPCGRLREHRGNIRRADFILITKTPLSMNAMDRRIMFRNLGKYPYQNLYFTTLKYGSPIPVFPGQAREMTWPEGIRGARVLLITGIANPFPIKEYLESVAGSVVHKRFPDHHLFTREEILTILKDSFFDQGEQYYIFTTEKDAIRIRMPEELPPALRENIWFIPVEAEFLNDDAEEFNNYIIDYVRKNKGNRRIPG